MARDESAVDLSFIQRARFKHTLPKNIDSQILQAKKLTHLCLQDKKLKAIGDLSMCMNLTMLYLQNNYITKIENLSTVVNLNSLFLQNNKIRKLENLESLVKLKKLNLARNEISVVEGLENLRNLEELYLEKQDLKDGDSLCFDPRSIFSISESLVILNVSNNNMTSITCLYPLKFLKYLDASYNKFGDVQEICDTIKPWVYLTEATFIGNPVCKKHKYRETIICNTHGLRILDKKNVTDITRCFIQRLEKEKASSASRPNINLPKKLTDVSKGYSESLQKAVTKSMMKDAQRLSLVDPENTEDTQSYVAWKALPPSKTVKASTQRKEIVSKKQAIVFNPFI